MAVPRSATAKMPEICSPSVKNCHCASDMRPEPLSTAIVKAAPNSADEFTVHRSNGRAMNNRSRMLSFDILV